MDQDVHGVVLQGRGGERVSEPVDRRTHEAEPLAVASEPSGHRVGVRRLTVSEHQYEAGVGPHGPQNQFANGLLSQPSSLWPGTARSAKRRSPRCSTCPSWLANRASL